MAPASMFFNPPFVCFLRRFVGVLTLSICGFGFVPNARGQTDPLEQWIAELKDPHYQVHDNAVRALAESKDPSKLDILIAALRDPNQKVREGAVDALGQTKDPRAVQPLLDTLLGAENELRFSASNSLAIIHDPNSIEPSRRGT